MPVTVVVGAQWGDEGKGKVVDHMARRMDWVARYQGGANAGHTVVIGKRKFVLHLVPSGVLHPRPKCVIGHGVVVDPAYLVEELDGLRERGIDLDGRLFVADGAHALLPYHRWIEALEEQDVKVGTTKRGVGPAYQDKMGRVGIRMCELIDRTRLRRRLEEHAEDLARRFRGAGVPPPQPIDAAVREWNDLFGRIGDRLRPHVADTVDMLHQGLSRGEQVLAEGAQGTFLDVDLGTYPFVTSSTTTSGGACSGLGIPPNSIRKVVGICKAYATRVGEGPFPTELHDHEAVTLRDRGGEFGATTGRPRRVGWCDLAQLRHAVRINGVTSLVLTKLDVLTGEPKIRFGVAYSASSDTGPRRAAHPLTDVVAYTACTPIYDEMPGWTEDLSAVRRWGDLPTAARNYVERIEDEVGAPVHMVSVGSGRSAVVRVPARRSRA